MQRTIFSPAEVSEMLGVPVETLRYWRHKGAGPRSFKLGPKHVRYMRDDLDAWIAEQRRSAVGDGAAAR